MKNKNQGSLFDEPDTAPDEDEFFDEADDVYPIALGEDELTKLAAKTLSDALLRCTDDWQRLVIDEWGRRHPQGAVAPPGFAPTPCICLYCKGPAVIFPGETKYLPENQGYCLCPRCSMPSQPATADETPHPHDPVRQYAAE